MRTLNDYFLTVKLADISSASSAFVAIPDAGEVVKILAVQEGAVSGGDAVLTIFTKDGGSTVMTGSGITVPYAGDAIGDVRTSIPSAVNTVSALNLLKVSTNGGSTGTCPLTVTFVIRR